MKPKIIEIDSFGKPGDGVLTVAVIQKDIPYEVKRIVWIYGVEDSKERGNHANLDTIQTFFVLNGNIKVSLTNEDGIEEVFELSKKNQGLVVPPNYWRTLVFSEDAILLVLNSHDYEETDYVRDIQDFLIQK